ncbi:hypothetical protein, partial [Cephaloticoccus primus]|uniref:hypothetical protein n=1 Tax=Cephaloticoccus primus TaxID=1548207 RepID=UPI0012E745D8
MPPLPSSYKQWNGPSSGGTWGSGPWIGGVPSSGDNVLFVPSTERADLSTGDHTVRSLWFQAGTFYTLNGSGTIKLSNGTPTGHILVVTNSVSNPRQSETNIESHIQLEGMPPRAYIENWSEGGLRIGGFFKLSDANVQFGGTGAIHLANQITNQDGKRANGNLYVEGSAGTLENVHVILSANNEKNWGGVLNVNDRGFLIVKENQALGEGSNKVVNWGGTIALRSHVGVPLTYTQPQQNNYISLYGLGIVRKAGTAKRIGALYNDGGWNSLDMRIDQVTQQNPVPVGFGSRGDRGGGLELRNTVRLTNPFHKLGPGLIVLNNTRGGGDANQWDKDTILKAGVLRLGSAGSLPSTSNLVFESDNPRFGGILELGYGGFTRSLGTGAGEVRWAGSGGFSAYGADRSVTLDTGVLGDAALTWDSTAHFLKDGEALLLSSRYATHNITLTNELALGAGSGKQREVRVERGEGSAHARLSGPLHFGDNTLRKTGRGLLVFDYLQHLYGSQAAVRIEDGAFLKEQGTPLFTWVNHQLAGGVFGVKGDTPESLDIALGTGPSQFQWLGDGGFAAYRNKWAGGTRSVTLNSGATLTWGQSPYFVAADKELRFGHYTADGTVDFTNNLNLGSGRRTIRVERGSGFNRADVLLSGKLSGDAGTQLWLVGDGRIDLTSADNFSTDVVNLLNIHGAELRLNRQGSLSQIANIIMGHGGTLYLDDLGTHDSNGNGSVNPDRIMNSGTLFFEGGSLIYRRGGTAVERVGALALNSGENSIQVFKAQDGEAWLYSTGLQRGDHFRSVLHFSEKEAQLRLVNDGSLDYNVGTGTGIVPWATAVRPDGSLGFAHIISDFFYDPQSSSPYQYILKALGTYHTGAADTWGTNGTFNVRMTGNQTLGANRTINSLVIGGGNLNLGANRTLTINSGGLIASGSGTRIINGSGQIATSNNRAFYVHTFGNLSLEGSARFSGTMDLVKSQSGTLTLGSNVNHTVGNVYIHRGTLDLKRGTLSVNGRIWIGDGGRDATLKLAPNRWNQIVRAGGALASITLNGTPYDPRGPEYGGAQAILQMGGNTKLSL